MLPKFPHFNPPFPIASGIAAVLGFGGAKCFGAIDPISMKKKKKLSLHNKKVGA